MKHVPEAIIPEIRTEPQSGNHDAGGTIEEIKRATGHRSNKAFDRYFQTDDDAPRMVFAKARRGGQEVVHLEASGVHVEPGFPVAPSRSS